MEGPLGVRKGAWTEEEDVLLRKCVEDYGEGKWHLVPRRTGLNRCRKSCRLRWLNYLRPNIKRGEFTLDEVDLIIRLHKLLGNRWSLIAGRIPGRTANDVKNYWNTHLHKKMISRQKEMKDKAKEMVKANVIKPRPRTFSRSSLPWFTGKPTIVDNNTVSEDNFCKPSPTPLLQEDGISWWERLLSENEVDMGGGSSVSGWSWEDSIANLWDEDIIVAATKPGESFMEGDQLSGWNEFSVNMELWDISKEQETVI